MVGHLHQRKVTLLQLVKPMCRLGLWTSRQLLLKTHYLLKMLISLSERKIKFTAFSLHLKSSNPQTTIGTEKCIEDLNNRIKSDTGKAIADEIP